MSAMASRAQLETSRPHQARALFRLGLLTLMLWFDLTVAAPAPVPADVVDDAPAVEAMTAVDSEPEDVDEEVQSLRERLTEREDENRLDNPISISLRGRPLIIAGEYEVGFDFIDELILGEPEEHHDRLLLEQEIETEFFYTLGQRLSLFAQLRLGSAHDLHRNTPESVANGYIERGEMWLYSERIGGSGFSIEAGRLDFEDDRLWWWDEDLDALRIAYEYDEVEVTLAAARELAPRSSDAHYIEPDDHQVLRYILEASWDWHEQHALELFALHQRDQSGAEQIGQTVRSERADESDGDLTWLGARASGAWQTSDHGVFGYWLDYARVHGDETVAEFEEESPTHSVVEEILRQRVRGQAWDVGATWVLPLRAEPRVSLGYAWGSGDRNPDDALDRSFHQTGLHGNEVAFGGVERFDHYGSLLDPELSNLSIFTIVVGTSLFQSSSLDLVYNRYRLESLAESLRDSRLELELNGSHRALGEAFDLIFAIEEGRRLQFLLTASAFRPGRAFAFGRGNWIWGGYLAARVAF